MAEMDGLRYWTRSGQETFVAEEDGDTLGTYYIRANQLGGRNHVAKVAT
jgi:hypothetical protein